MLTIRLATVQDAKALVAIYQPYVTNTVITFEYDVPSVDEFAQRIQATLAHFPFLVAEVQGEIVGYAYASPFNRRAAYEWTVEVSIYLAESAKGKGYGKQLYEALAARLLQQGVITLTACIAYPGEGSIAFHERQGFHKVAHFERVGYKFGEWHDVVWYQKAIQPHTTAPAPLGKVEVE